MSQEEAILTLNLEHSMLIKRLDGVIEVHCVDVYYGKKECEEITAAIGKLSGGERALVLLIGSNYSSIDKEGREYGSSEEGTRFSIAEAYIIKSMAQKIIANFYMRVNKPVVPTRFFQDKEDAEEWLKSFRK